MLTEESVRTMLMDVIDPEIGVNIIDLGLVYDIKINGNEVRIKMTLTSPGCPAGPEIINNVKLAILKLKEVDKVDVMLVWTPMWNSEMMTDEVREDLLGFF
ncbi:MAG: putative 1,2-phenylacetyl-CoA epoxidase, subunit D [Candidatus Scalindua rubra]|uniref:Putative 1,2-phenylacetyl-CoA epoxidase, subunit D n=1 Tax=Candidatus Scalindua rubra TaxID=1872076 RepID=A0A1E3X5T0_9BACT|nr:MAG: putative 1,2-phenylacetyl-CoA epoxidase, subunit D [Candidatus Scalindua rubra]